MHPSNSIKTNKWMFLVPPLADCTMPMLGPYLLKNFLQKKGIVSKVFDTSIEFLYNALNSKNIQQCAVEQRLSKTQIDFLKTFAQKVKKETSDNLLKLKAATMILTAIGGQEKFTLDEVFWNFSVNSIRNLNKAIKLIAWCRNLFITQPFYKELYLYINVGISVAFSSQLPFALLLAKIIKEEFPQINITLGGTYFSCYEISPSNLLKHFKYINSIIVGNGEEVLVNLTTDSHLLPQIYYQEHSHQEYIPDFSGVKWAKYCVHNKIRPIPFSLRTSCYYAKCSFCNGDNNDSQNCTKNKFNDLIPIIKKLLKICNKQKITHVYFTDAALPPMFLEKLAELIDGHFHWGINTRIDKPFSQDFFDHLFRNGCEMLRVGMETASQKVLNLMHKGTKVENYIPYFSQATQAGIRVHTYLMFGFPGETEDDRLKTLDFLKKIKDNIYSYSISIFHAIPETPIYNELATNFGLTPQDDIDVNHLYYTEESYKNVCSYIERASIILSNSLSNCYCYAGRIFQQNPVPNQDQTSFSLRNNSNDIYILLKRMFLCGMILPQKNQTAHYTTLSVNIQKNECLVWTVKREKRKKVKYSIRKWGLNEVASHGNILQNNLILSTKE